MPDAEPILVALTILLGVSSRSAASQLHGRWLADRGLHPFPAYVAVLGAATALGVSAIGFAPLVPDNLMQAFRALGIGLIAGVAAVNLDGLVLRVWTRLCRTVEGSGAPIVEHDRPTTDQSSHLRAPPWGLPLVRRNWLRWALLAAKARWSPGRLVVLAVLEEWVFRGVVLALCLRLPPVVMALSSIAATIAFGVSHSYAGWGHAVAKSVVGFLLLGAALTAGTAAAVVAHVLFNTAAWWSSFRVVRSRAAS